MRYAETKKKKRIANERTCSVRTAMRIRTKEKLVPDAGPYGHGPQIVLRYGYLREAERMLTKQRRAEDREAQLRSELKRMD